MSESFEEQEALLKERLAAEEHLGELEVSGSAEVEVGHIGIGGTVDPEHLSAEAHAEAVTVSGSAEVEVETPVGTAGAEAEAQGPSLEAEAEAGLDGVGATIGASAGSASAETGVEVVGKDFNVGVEVGSKVELGVEFGATTELELPLISVEVPTPEIAAAEIAAEGVKDLVTDPAGTVEDVITDFGTVAGDVGDAVKNVIGSSEPDDHVVTTDEFGGPKHIQPGAKPID
jgi:hypothetical protein